MVTQDSTKPPARRVLDRIVAERFTGLLRVSSQQANGEFWFLAGILEDARFGASKGDEALERLLNATQPAFQAELRLPYVTGGFKKPMPTTGSFAEFRPVVLMRYCESNALTCALELRGKDRTVRVTYRTGELLSADAAAAGNEALAGLLESQEGTYEFTLPTFELPEGVAAATPSTPPKLSLAERIDRSLADESAAEAERKALAEQAAKEAKRKADEAAAAEAKRKADEAAAAEAKRKADEAAAAEARRKADEAKRRADEAAAAEAKRKADEAKRKADEAAAAEAKRKADEAAAAEAKRKADEAAAAEAKRKADEAAAAEAKRKADEAAAAEAKRKADEAAAEAKRKADEAAAEAKRKAAPSRAAKAVKPKSESAKKSGKADRRSLPARTERKGAEPTKVEPKSGFPWILVVGLLLVLAAALYFTQVR
jgi:hypothetical protein